MYKITLVIVIGIKLSNNGSLVITVTDYSLVSLQLKFCRMQDTWSVQFRFLCHNF